MTADSRTLTINEIYESIQGESSWTGWRCVFVRLTFCDLRCTYCDTEYAFYKGQKMRLSDIVDQVLSYRVPLVEVTGGEPLLQPNVLPLMTMLCEAGLRVLIETSGSHDISRIDSRVYRIMDLKTPSSGECERNLYDNIQHLTRKDEVKFVIGGEQDYEWSCQAIENLDLLDRVKAVLFSPVFGKQDPRKLAEWVLRDKLDVRLQMQLHKFIWDPAAQGV